MRTAAVIKFGFEFNCSDTVLCYQDANCYGSTVGAEDSTSSSTDDTETESDMVMSYTLDCFCNLMKCMLFVRSNETYLFYNCVAVSL